MGKGHKGKLASYASAALITWAVPVGLQAQTVSDQRSPERNFLVPSQLAGAGVTVFARQADVQILIVSGPATERRINRVEGRFSVEEAIRLLLRNTGLVARQTVPGTFLVELDTGPKAVVQDEQSGAIPDILVEGSRGWSLNTGIKRTENDSQPFIVLDQKAIKRSGAPNLETFLRDQLSVNASAGTAEQAGGVNRNRSVVNLRGLGERETLILIDGRRMPGINTGNGLISQPDISSIALDSIERIEVLASSASGIYGSGATGGVVNIVLRRDYTGLSLTATQGGTFAGGRNETRIDLTGGMALEDGKTNISLTGSWRYASPLLNSDRPEFLVEGRRRALENNPNAYPFQAPLGATPNIRAAGGGLLTLDPEYGGATLSSNRTFVPTGYRGLAADGVAGLVANAGNYNLDLADSAELSGGLRPLMFKTRQGSGSLAIRREMASWLRLYVEGAASTTTSYAPVSLVPSIVRLDADAPNNPFTRDIIITVPQIGADRNDFTRNTQLRGLVGGIVQIGGGWQAVIDLARSRTRSAQSRGGPTVDGDTVAAMEDGSVDVLRDIRLAPITYGYLDSRYGAVPYQTPGISNLTTLSARIAGPLPVRLPGGQPQITTNLEYSKENSGSTRAVRNGVDYSAVTFTPNRSQRIQSAYAEMTLPLIGVANKIPAIRELELKLAVRHERYKGQGADADFQCFLDFAPIPNDGVFDACPARDAVIARSTTINSHTDPTISLRWAPISDITFRGSYATGYLPPYLNQLVRIAQPVYTNAVDTKRGGEVIGTLISDGFSGIDGFTGGNPDVKPESSKTWSFGAIVQPRFVSGLRLSADWARITKRNNYFQADFFLDTGFTAEGQAAFDRFLALYPDRITRGPASDGFDVGAITSIDVSTANLAGSTSETVDFAADYTHKLFGGTVDLSSRATWVRELSVQQFPGAAKLDYTGVSDATFTFGQAGLGSVKWKGFASLNWSNDQFGFGWTTRYTDGYFVNLDRSVAPSLGSARVPSQTYHDVNARYVFGGGLTLRAGVNNVFNKRPPFDTSVQAQIYSKFGDPRLANFYLTLNKTF